MQDGGGGGGKREGPIETYPKFWNLNHLTADLREILGIPARKGGFGLVKRELEKTLEKEILPTAVPVFPIVRRMTLEMKSPLWFDPCTQEPRWRNSRRSSQMAGTLYSSDI